MNQKRLPQPRAKDNRRLCTICVTRVSPERWAEHYDRCLRKRAELAQTNTKSSPSPSKRPSQRKSRGPRIDHCPLCHRRVYRVGGGAGGFRYNEITRSGRGERHLCDGQAFGGRRTQLLYVSPEAAVTKRVNSSRRRPKNGGTQRAK